MVGQTISHYKVLEKIGQGGMGEVYLAEDSRLDRKVALKILPQHLAERAEPRERFEREARAVSSLNHPHICTLHDIGEQDGIHFLVMEHVEGETLAARLERGSLSLEQTLEYAIQIADAMDKAHRQGVVHRDLKPGNIMLTKSGAKLLDFGLAKLQAADAPSDLSSLPTQRADLTVEGTILGTLQYMAPEQLEAKEADSRTDIFAFGAVVYEMTTGKKAFAGKSQASLIGAILKDDPLSMSELQPMTPSVLGWVVKRCLKKEPDERVQTAADLVAELRWVVEGGSEQDVAAPVVSGHRNRERIAWGLASLGAGVIITLLALWYLKSPPPPNAVIRFPFRTLKAGSLNNVVISPDGRRIVFESKRGLFVWELDQFHSRFIEGTEGGQSPFMSPNGRSLGFKAGGKMRKVSLTGGDPVDICDVGTLPGAAWSPDGTILFSPDWLTGLWRVSSAGGEPEPLTTIDPDEGEIGHWWPVFLPDGKAILFTIFTSRGSLKNARMAIFNLQTREKTILGEGAYPRYVSSGHLVYQRAGSFEAVPFDLADLRVTGPPVTVLEEAPEAESDWNELLKSLFFL